MSRVLQIAGSLNVGGAETALLNLARALPPNRVNDVSFLVFGNDIGTYEHELIESGFAIHHAPYPKWSNQTGMVCYLKRLMAETGHFSVVHSHVNFASGLILSASRRAGIPTRIAHAHMSGRAPLSPIGQAYEWAARRMLRSNATNLLACSSDAGQFVFGSAWNHGGLVVPNGVDPSPFRAAFGERAAVRKELCISDDSVVVGVVARLAEVKNISHLLSLMARDSSTKPFHLVVAGEGPEASHLKRQALELGLSDRVKWLGLRRDVPRLLGAFDVLAMPSYREGLPLSLLEAQAAGLPSVVSDVITEEATVIEALVKRVPLDQPSTWLNELYAQAEQRVDCDIASHAFHSSGFGVDNQLRILSSLYGWTNESP